MGLLNLFITCLGFSLELHPLPTLESSCWHLVQQADICSLCHIFRQKNNVADCWKFWEQRNHYVFQNKLPQVQEAISHIKKFLRNYWQVNHIPFKKWKNKNATSYGWNPPKNEFFYKIYFDGIQQVQFQHVQIHVFFKLRLWL